MRFLTFVIGVMACLSAMAQATTELARSIAKLPCVTEVKALESSEFAEKYQLMVEQPLDYRHPELGNFCQRVILAHVGFDRPTVLVTEGYGAAYALRSGYREELSRLLNANMIFVEYRYFLDSTPKPCNWDYLTVENSLADLHRITTTFKTLYSGKWISTGISKGGQTTMFYRAYYPDDVDVSVPYVAPLNRSTEDGRHEIFLAKKVSTPENRAKVLQSQMTLFKRKAELLPMLANYCAEKGYTFRIPMDEVFDYCVLEYSFAFWQWGASLEEIPASTVETTVLFHHLMEKSEPGYFSMQNAHLSFNVQAARELGYYGYDIRPFKSYLSIRTSKNYLRRLMLPEELERMKFDNTLYRHTMKYLKSHDPRMIFIYGEDDPWSASGVIGLFPGKKNMQVYVQPGGSHKARIGTLPAAMKQQVIRQLKDWLGEEMN